MWGISNSSFPRHSYTYRLSNCVNPLKTKSASDASLFACRYLNVHYCQLEWIDHALTLHIVALPVRDTLGSFKEGLLTNSLAVLAH